MDLIEKAQSGDRKAQEELLERSQRTIDYIVHKYNVPLMDKADLEQEAKYEIIAALPNYDSTKSAWDSYIWRVVDNSLQDLLNHARRPMRSLHMQGSYETLISNSENDYDYSNEIICGSTVPTIQGVLDKMVGDDIREVAKSICTPLQYKVFMALHNDDLTYPEAAKMLGLTTKQIDNANCRAKNNLKRYYELQVSN